MRQAQRSTTPWRKAQYLLYKQSRDSPTKWTVKTNTYSLFASATVPPVLIRDGPRIRTITPNSPRASSLFSPAQAGIYALGKAFMRSAPCLGGFHSVAFEKVSMLLFSLSLSLSLSLSQIIILMVVLFSWALTVVKRSSGLILIGFSLCPANGFPPRYSGFPIHPRGYL